MTTGERPTAPQPDRPTHVIAHLSDTHLTSAGVRYNGVLDSDAALHRAVAVLRDAVGAGRRLDAVVLSGDLTDSGDPDAYHRLAAAVASIGVGPVPIYATGNHDVRREFHRQLLQRNDTAEPIRQVHQLDGLRIIVLDSTIPRAGHGRLTADHLAELERGTVAIPAPAGTIVVLHHAPLPPPSPLLSYFALERASRTALAAAVAGSDVRLILAGHHHIAQSAMLGRHSGGGRRFDGHPHRPAGAGRARAHLGQRIVQPGRGLPRHHRGLGHPGRRRGRRSSTSTRTAAPTSSAEFPTQQ